MTIARLFSIRIGGPIGLALVLLCGCSSSPTTEEKIEAPPLKPRLVCVRGLKEKAEYPLREGHNFIGRGTKWGSAHVDLTEQELPGQEKIAPEHARLILEDGKFYLEDMNTSRGTFLNGQRLPPGKQETLKAGDLIQTATVQLRFLTAPDANAGKLVPISPMRLVCCRGMKRGTEYLLFEGENLVGKPGKEPTEVDLDDQEIADRPYLSDRHVRITASGSELTVEDLNSTHGTYVNRKRLAPGSKQALKPGDTLMLGVIRLQAVLADKVRAFQVPAPLKLQLQVVKGAKPNLEYALYEGENYIGRPGELAVDIDLSEQEGAGRSSLQHAVVSCSDGKLTIEDLSSTDGTFVNRSKIKPGTKVPLKVKDTIQIGAVEFLLTE